MLLPFLLTREKPWKHCKLRIFTVARILGDQGLTALLAGVCRCRVCRESGAGLHWLVCAYNGIYSLVSVCLFCFDCESDQFVITNTPDT